MPFAKPAVPFAILLIAASSQMAAAQSAEAVPAAPDAAVTPPVDAWNVVVSPTGGSVRISKAANDGSARFSGGCEREAGLGLGGAFSGYQGEGLRKVDGEVERVLIEVRGAQWKDVFSAQLRYVANRGSWELARVLAPVFLDSFARGGELAVLNDQRHEVFSFGLTGSANAASTMREICIGKGASSS